MARNGSPKIQRSLARPFNTRNKIVGVALFGGLLAGISLQSAPPTRHQLSTTFQQNILAAVGPESPEELRLFTGPVKTDSRGRIITGPNHDPVKTIVGAESAGIRAGLERFTKILFPVSYDSGSPDPGKRINPNAPAANSGNQHWPHRDQPFRGWPNSIALTPNGGKVYVSLPGREGYPDWRVASVDTVARKVLRWIDLRPAGTNRGTRPM